MTDTIIATSDHISLARAAGYQVDDHELVYNWLYEYCDGKPYKHLNEYGGPCGGPVEMANVRLSSGHGPWFDSEQFLYTNDAMKAVFAAIVVWLQDNPPEPQELKDARGENDRLRC